MDRAQRAASLRARRRRVAAAGNAAPAAVAFWVSVPLAIAGVAAWSAWRAGHRNRVARATTLVSIVIAAGLAGFCYAAWRAEVRLADALPSEWEGRDIDVVGVIEELPQPVDRGTRFAFAVERAVTPDAVVPSTLSLAWYSAYARGGALDVDADAVPALHAGERWDLVVRLKRPHGTVNPNGFDVEARLLQNNRRATGYVRKDDANRRLRSVPCTC
jgi:competence protein ComEC